MLEIGEQLFYTGVCFYPKMCFFRGTIIFKKESWKKVKFIKKKSIKKNPDKYIWNL